MEQPKTRAITVQRLMRGEESHLEELSRLAEAAGYTVVGSVEQVRRPSSGYPIGKGKVSELAGLVKELNADKIIFGGSLSPIQAYNVAKVTGVECIDRFQLILEIFTKRASTKEAQLQIQLANLRYQLPRARESVRLARTGEQPGFMGLGRYEIDTYLEAMKRQIAHIRGELRNIRRKRSLQRAQRVDSGYALVSLAGYTYAGKTTLFNRLASESKAVDQGLFTTLSTTSRAVDLYGRKILLTDTVGFIDRLPLALIEAFRSTLEETVLSDAIVLVVDFQEPLKEIRRKLSSCIDTLNEIGAQGIPIITALNKTDALSDAEAKERQTALGEELVQNPVPISALKGLNLDELKQKIAECLGNNLTAHFTLPLSDEALSYISGLYGQVEVLSVVYEGKNIRVTLRAAPWLLERVRGQMEKLGGQLLEAPAKPV